MRLLSTILAIMMSVVASAQRCHYLPEDSVFITRLLDSARTLDGSECKELFFAGKFLGRPYVAHTLEVFDDERLVINTRQLDCTTLVENVAALTMCANVGKLTFSDFRKALMTLRYRGGVMNGYTSRLHYFSDWIEDKTRMGIVREIQEPNPPFTALQRLSVYYMSGHPKAYKALAADAKLVPVIRRQEQALNGKTYRYIPKAAVRNDELMRKAVKDGDIIAITCNKKGLDIAHLGYAVWHDDGLHLLNASMIHRKVVKEPMTLREYLGKHPSHTGIRIIRINSKTIK